MCCVLGGRYSLIDYLRLQLLLFRVCILISATTWWPTSKLDLVCLVEKGKAIVNEDPKREPDG